MDRRARHWTDRPRPPSRPRPRGALPARRRLRPPGREARRGAAPGRGAPGVTRGVPAARWGRNGGEKALGQRASAEARCPSEGHPLPGRLRAGSRTSLPRAPDAVCATARDASRVAWSLRVALPAACSATPRRHDATGRHRHGRRDARDCRRRRFRRCPGARDANRNRPGWRRAAAVRLPEAARAARPPPCPLGGRRGLWPKPKVAGVPGTVRVGR